MVMTAIRPRRLFPFGDEGGPMVDTRSPKPNPVSSTTPGTSQLRVLPAPLLRDDEVVLLALRPHPLYILLAPLLTYVVVIIAAVLCSIIVAGFESMSLPWTWSIAQNWLVAGVLLALRFGWACLQWYNQLYLLTDRRILTRGGVLRVGVYETSLRHVRQTLVHVSIRERCFGLGTLLVATAGTAIYDTAWIMLRHPVQVQRTVQNALARWGSEAN